MAEQGDDVALIRRWFQKLQLCVQTVDFTGSHPLFADDLITFGTYAAFTVGREATEHEQWRHVWGRIDQFRWRLDDLRTLVSGDRLTAVGMAVFESTGYTEDGKAFERLGRATVVLGRRYSGGRLSARIGWRSTRTCRCFPARPRAPSAPSRSSHPLCSGTDTASR